MAQANLFSLEESSPAIINGLRYIPAFISPKQETRLIADIDRQPWLNDLKRRVQHYGWRYDYAARRVDASMRLRDIPGWLIPYGNVLQEQGHFAQKPDQIIVNEYLPGQGISSHIDCVPCFEETIASLSLGSPCVMDFIHADTQEKQSLLLEPRSLLVLSGDARYRWKHGIAARKTDKYNGQSIQRRRRIALTFRNVIIP